MGFDIDIVKHGGVYTSCRYIQWEVHFNDSRIETCGLGNDNNVGPNAPFAHQQPVLYDNMTGDIKFNEEFFDKIYSAKLEFIRKINSGEFCICTNCPSLQTKEWEPIPKLRLNRFQFAQDHICNSSCIYCSLDHTKKAPYSVKALINAGVELGYIDVDNLYHTGWAGGEPTLMDGFEELFDRLKNVKLMTAVASTGIIFSEGIAKLLEQDGHETNINVSLDSGDRETYKKVKQVDQFDKVVENIDKYYKRAKNKINIHLKYIVLAENCSMEQVDNFINLVKNKGWYGITVFVSCDTGKDVTDDIRAAAYYLSLKIPLVTGTEVRPFVFERLTKDFNEKFNTKDMAKFGQLKHMAEEKGISLDDIIELVHNVRK